MRLSSFISALGLVCIAESASIDPVKQVSQVVPRSNADDPGQRSPPEIVLASRDQKAAFMSAYVPRSGMQFLYQNDDEYKAKNALAYRLFRDSSKSKAETPCKNDGFTCVHGVLRHCHEGRTWYNICQASEVCAALPMMNERKLVIDCFDKERTKKLLRDQMQRPF